MEAGEGATEVRDLGLADTTGDRTGFEVMGQELTSNSHTGGVTPACESHPGLGTEAAVDVVGDRRSGTGGHPVEEVDGGLPCPRLLGHGHSTGGRCTAR